MRKISMCLLAASLCLCGCGGIEKAETSTVTVDKDGVVTSVLVEEFTDKHYDISELESTITEWVQSYNTANGDAQVTLKDVESKEGVARVMMEYASDDAYRGFNQVDFFAGTVKEAQEQGYAFAGDFADAQGNDVQDGTIPASCQEEHVLIIREPLDVLAPGKILYVSKNMKVVSDKEASYEGASDDSSVVTDAYGYIIYRVK